MSLPLAIPLIPTFFYRNLLANLAIRLEIKIKYISNLGYFFVQKIFYL